MKVFTNTIHSKFLEHWYFGRVLTFLRAVGTGEASGSNADVFQTRCPDWLKTKVRSVRRDPFYAGQTELVQVFELLEKDLKRSGFQSLSWTGISDEDLRRLALQRIDFYYTHIYQFAKTIQPHMPAGYELVVGGPKALRRAFEQLKHPINRGWSKILWGVLCWKLFRDGMGVTFRNIVSTWKEWATRNSRVGLPPVSKMVFGLAQKEVTGNSARTNFASFIESKVIAPFREPGAVYLQADWVDGIDEIKSEARTDTEFNTGAGVESPSRKTFLTPNPFYRLHLTQNSLAAFGFALRETAGYLMGALRQIRIGLVGNWAERMLAPSLAEVPRVRTWFEVHKPKAIMHTYTLYNGEIPWTALARQYGCELWMLMYHANHDCLAYLDEPHYSEVAAVDRYEIADHITMWDETQKIYYHSLGIANDRLVVTGPVMFVKTPTQAEAIALARQRLAKNKDRARIAIFDLAPVELDYMLVARGIGNYHNRAENVTRFHENIYVACMDTFGAGGFELLFKPKRNLDQWKTSYADFMKAFVRRPGVTLLPADTNPFDIVAQSLGVISAPFTSTSRFSAWMGWPATFYDVTAELQYNYPSEFNPSICRGPSELKSWLEARKAEMVGASRAEVAP